MAMNCRLKIICIYPGMAFQLENLDEFVGYSSLITCIMGQKKIKLEIYRLYLILYQYLVSKIYHAMFWRVLTLYRWYYNPFRDLDI